MTTTAAQLLAQASIVLLDFDGPVCSVFAGTSAAKIAALLRDSLPTDAISDCGTTTTDPLEVLRLAAAIDGGTTLTTMEGLLRAAELKATLTAAPTPGAKPFIQACESSGRRVAIVSNNSTEAISQYMHDANLNHCISVIAGRPYARPDLMKPDPYLLTAALKELNTQREEAVFIGDSTSDVEAGNRLRIPTIGYANKPGKTERLAEAGAHAIVTDMGLLASYVLAANAT